MFDSFTSWFWFTKPAYQIWQIHLDARDLINGGLTVLHNIDIIQTKFMDILGLQIFVTLISVKLPVITFCMAS